MAQASLQSCPHTTIPRLLQPLPQQNPPSPTLEKLHVLFLDTGITILQPRAEFLDALLRRPSDPQRDLVGEDEENGKDDKSNFGKPPSAEETVLDVLKKTFGFAKGILGVVG